MRAFLLAGLLIALGLLIQVVDGGTPPALPVHPTIVSPPVAPGPSAVPVWRG